MALRREMNALRDHLETLELTDGIDALRRQLTNLVAELATPNKQKVALLQNYTRMLQLVFRVGDATQRHVTRAEGSLRRLCRRISWTCACASTSIWTVWRRICSRARRRHHRRTPAW